MCFSPEVSFAAAGVLVGLGVYCVAAARRTLPRYWAFAVIPIGFGLQQMAEGVVWLAIHHRDESLTHIASAVFLFFGLAVWPTWFPVAAWVAETDRRRRLLLFVFALLSTAWFWFAYLPALTAPAARLSATVVGHSIHYGWGDEEVLGRAVRWPVTALYVLCVGGPVLLNPRFRRRPLLIVLAGLTVGVAAWIYTHAYTSVWCFFAALLSAYTAYFFATASPEP